MSGSDEWNGGWGRRIGVGEPLDAAAALIGRVLEQRAVFPLYQPIMDLATAMVVGVESLARGPAGTVVESPGALFAAAARAGLMPLIDQLCFTRAVEIAREAGEVAPPLVFINAEPAALNQPMTPALLAAVEAERPFRIVMEFTERRLAAHPAALLNIAAIARQGGDALALDDVGADPLSVALLPLLEPEVVKLDMHLLRNPHAPRTIETAAIVAAYAERTGAMVLAEGIETEHDLATARALGARWGQGWLFARPGPLSALADRPVDRHAALRASRPGALQPPVASPFTMAAMRHQVRTGDQPMIDGLTGYLLSLAASIGPYAVVLGAYPNPTLGGAWLARLAHVSDAAAFVGVVGPALTDVDPHQVRMAAAAAADPADAETTLAVVGPQAAVALCARPGRGGGTEFVLTHDADLVHAVARTLMWRLGTALRLNESARRRYGQPATQAGPPEH
ncbi:EAL domain-containing protein [Catellatospora tritici]|uniref:EAL domain-containing protein n=1 Tax=Catellatospora tritici TaxID=2851566 RepID=UPI0027DF7959|nr:EAL domain-containing protein [Catellatospora tritici]